MNKYINYFLNYLQTEKDAAKSTIYKYTMIHHRKLKILLRIKIYSVQRGGVILIKLGNLILV